MLFLNKKDSLEWLIGDCLFFLPFFTSDFSSSFSRCSLSRSLVLSVQSLSRVRLCDPMNHSTPGLPVHHQLLEFTQIHVHWVGDAIQPSHPLSSPSPPAPNPCQHQSSTLMQMIVPSLYCSHRFILFINQ